MNARPIVELTSPYPHFWNVDEFKKVEGPPEVSEKEWLAEMRKRYREVFGCEEFHDLDIPKGFAFGLSVTIHEKNWNFTNPPSRKRYYFYNHTDCRGMQKRK